MIGKLRRAVFWRVAHVAASLAVFWLSVAPISAPFDAPDWILGPDKLVHLGMHAGLGALAAAGWGRWDGLAAALWLATYFEAAQLTAAGRSFAGGDLAANLAGAAFGALAAARAVSLSRARG